MLHTTTSNLGALGRIFAAAAISVSLASATGSSVGAAPTPVLVDFNAGSWNGGTGYPQDMTDGTTGVDGAVADLGAGLSATVEYSEAGTATAAGREGTDLGNLAILDGDPVPDLDNPGTPVPGQCSSTETTPFPPQIPAYPGDPEYGCHETDGFALSISSLGANNGATLENYVRYDVTFNGPVTLPNGVSISDIDSFIVDYPTAPNSPQVELYQDAVGFETWTTTPGAPGTGDAPTLALGANLEADTISGVSFARTAATPVGGRGGLSDSTNVDHRATFTPAGAITGFSIYYWDALADDLADPGVLPTVALDNFVVTPVQSEVELTKVVAAGATPWSFEIVLSGGDPATQTVTLTDGAPTDTLALDPGTTYTVSETAADGFELVSINCGDGTATFVAPIRTDDSGPEVSCLITNTEVIATTTTSTTTTTTTVPEETTTTTSPEETTTTEPVESTTTTTPPETTTTGVPTTVLPETGGSPAPSLVIGALLAAFGLAMMTLSRRTA